MAYRKTKSTLIDHSWYRSAEKGRRAYSNWVAADSANVFGTLKFNKKLDYERPPTESLLWHVSLFWNKMDRLYYANRAEKGVRIPRHCFLHMGDSKENPHVHFTAHVDGNVDLFCELAALVWRDLSRKTTSKSETRIEPLRNLRACAIYSAKENLSLRGDSYQPHLSHIRREDGNFRPIDMNKLEERLLQKMRKYSL